MRHLFVLGTLICSLFLPIVAAAQEEKKDADFKAGVNYEELANPKKMLDDNKIEALLFFWYGCRGCYLIEPAVDLWEKKLPEDVRFSRVPAMFGGVWNLHGQVFLTLKNMGVKHDVHMAVFEAVQKKRMQIKGREDLPELLKEIGIDPEAFFKVYDSAEIEAEMKKAEEFANIYDLKAVPAMVINGKYRFELDKAGGPQGFFKLTISLIEQERKANKN